MLRDAGLRRGAVADHDPAVPRGLHDRGPAPTRRGRQARLERAARLLPTSGIPGRLPPPHGGRCRPAQWRAARCRPHPALHARLDPASPRRGPAALRRHPALLHGGGKHPGNHAVRGRGQPLVPIPGKTGPAPVQRDGPVRHARWRHGRQRLRKVHLASPAGGHDAAHLRAHCPRRHPRDGGASQCAHRAGAAGGPSAP